MEQMGIYDHLRFGKHTHFRVDDEGHHPRDAIKKKGVPFSARSRGRIGLTGGPLRWWLYLLVRGPPRPAGTRRALHR